MSAFLGMKYFLFFKFHLPKMLNSIKILRCQQTCLILSKFILPCSYLFSVNPKLRKNIHISRHYKYFNPIREKVGQHFLFSKIYWTRTHNWKREKQSFTQHVTKVLNFAIRKKSFAGRSRLNRRSPSPILRWSFFTCAYSPVTQDKVNFLHYLNCIHSHTVDSQLHPLFVNNFFPGKTEKTMSRSIY